MQVVIWVLAAFLACASATEEKKIVCYFGSWSVYRSGNGNIDIDTDIDPTLCTHLMYAFTGLTAGGKITMLDQEADIHKGGFHRFNQLRNKNPKLKTLVSVGGWNEGSTKFSEMVFNSATRKAFIKNALGFVKKYGFHGLDVDWEYPSQRGGVLSDKKNFVLLLKELREAFDKEGLLVTAAVASAEISASLSYIIPEVSKYCHFINLMTYDLHGVWDKKTGLNAPLFPGSWETGDDRKLNVKACVDYWISQGCPKEKIILGMPFYGHSYTLDNTTRFEIGAPASKPGQAGPYTKEAGTLGYNEICESQLTEEWNIYYEKEQRAPYCVKGNQWVSYDDSRSIREKAELVKEMGLGGAMVWSIESDDFKGICGEKYPLLKTLNRCLSGYPEQPAPTPKPDPHECGVTCYAEDFRRDPCDCSVFYRCVSNGPGKGFRKYHFNCPAGTYFDLNLDVCNYKDQVNCKPL